MRTDDGLDLILEFPGLFRFQTEPYLERIDLPVDHTDGGFHQKPSNRSRLRPSQCHDLLEGGLQIGHSDFPADALNQQMDDEANEQYGRTRCGHRRHDGSVRGDVRCQPGRDQNLNVPTDGMCVAEEDVGGLVVE